MKTLQNLFLLLLLTTLFLTSCKEDGIKPKPNSLLASAGADQTVQTGQTVTLDGSASKDGGNQPFSYTWAFNRKPANSTATLTGATTANPTFIPDLPGEYELELTITNAAGSHKDKVLIIASSTAMILEDITVKTVLEDRIVDANLPDYLVNDDIAVDAELTVKPGVVIAFAQDMLMQINEGGVLIAKGEEHKKIKFTGKMAQKGYWRGIMFYSRSSSNELAHVEISYGGSKAVAANVKANITVSEEARITLKNATVSFSGGYGLYLREGSLLHAFAANTFQDNIAAPVLLAADQVPMLDAATVFTKNNGINAIEVMGSSIAETSEVVWPAFNDKTPYRFLNQITVQSGWKLRPGITIEVAEDKHIEIADGYINAVGTAEKKITFTGVSQTAGSWNGIIIYPRSASNVMEQVQIGYAGGNELISNVKSSIVLTHEASLSIKNSSISHSRGYGIYVNDRNVTLNADAATSNTFTAIALQPIFYANAPNTDPDTNLPSSTIPSDIKDGIWFWGNSGPLSYYDNDGNEVGSATEAGRQYKFYEINGQGRIQFEQYLGMRNASNCVTEIYTRKNGTVKFEGKDRFSFYPAEGSFKTVKSGTSASCGKGTTERKATQDDLAPITYLYEIRVVQGKKLLYVFLESDANYTNPLFVYQKVN